MGRHSYVTTLSGIVAILGVVGAIALILGLSALAERWLYSPAPISSVEPRERSLVRVRQQVPVGRGASEVIGPQSSTRREASASA